MDAKHDGGREHRHDDRQRQVGVHVHPVRDGHLQADEHEDPAEGLEWLLVFGSLLHLRRPVSAWLWGTVVALLLLDYEGWLLSLPGFAALGWYYLKNTRLRPWASLGFTLGAIFVLALNHEWFQASASVRLDQTLPGRLPEALTYFIVHLRELVFGGGRALLYLGVPNHPQIAPWAWLGLLGAGPWIRRHWLWIFAILPPLAALALHAPSIEPNRCLAAWPLLCLTIGIGFARLSKVRSWALGALFFWALLGVGIEIHAQAEALRQWGPLFYGDSWNQLAAGKFVREKMKSCTLLSDLSPQSGADFRFATGLAPDKLNQGPLLAWIPWQDQPQLDSSAGTWHAFQALPDQGPCLLLTPNQTTGEKLLTVNNVLAPLWAIACTQPINQSRQRLEHLTAIAIEDPRLRTALWESRFKLANYLGRPLADEGALGLKLKLLRVDPLIRAARRISCQDPASLALVVAGCRVDPRRRELWQLYLSRLQCLGRVSEQLKLERQLEENPALGQIRASWLQD